MSLNILRELKFSDIIVAMFLRRSSAVSQYDLSQSLDIILPRQDGAAVQFCAQGRWYYIVIVILHLNIDPKIVQTFSEY